MKNMKKGAVALCIAFFSSQTLSAPATQTVPEVAAQQFYTWYLNALSQDQSPVDEHDPRLSKYVTPQLLKKITTLIKTPEGMDNDFFLQDQDYSDSWIGQVTTGRFTLNGVSASGEVILGNEPAEQRHLLVTLHQDRVGWRIDDVANEEE